VIIELQVSSIIFTSIEQVTKTPSKLLTPPTQVNIPSYNQNPSVLPSPMPGLNTLNNGQLFNKTMANLLLDAFPPQRKDPSRYQNAIGFNVRVDDYGPQSMSEPVDPRINNDLQRKSNVPFKLPNGPSAYFSELRGAMSNNLNRPLPQTRRQQINPPNQKAFPYSKTFAMPKSPAAMYNQLNPAFGQPTIHTIPFKNSHFWAGNYPNRAVVDARRSQTPVQPHQADPRWFAWTQGLAQTKGATTTNTHSNSLQKNSPGSVATNTHTSSTQNSQGETEVKQMYGRPGGLGYPLLRNEPKIMGFALPQQPQQIPNVKTFSPLLPQQQNFGRSPPHQSPGVRGFPATVQQQHTTTTTTTATQTDAIATTQPIDTTESATS